MRIICISGKAQHGKDTSAIMLRDYLTSKGNRVLITHFGDLLKYICTAFFDWNGEKDDYGRTLLQQVGTQVIRRQEPDFWVDFIVKITTFFKGSWDYVLLPDCRFPNEYEAFAKNGFDAMLLRIVRDEFESPLSEEQQQHESEIALDGYEPDYTIINDENINTLKERVILFAEHILLGSVHSPSANAPTAAEIFPLRGDS